MFISILTGVIVGLLSSQIARSALPPIDMINDSFVENPWIEVGYIDLDDQNWVEVSTNSSTFEDAVVFISLPFTEDVNHSLPLTARVRDVRNNNGIISFETRLYQPNDSFCSKEWKIPTPVSPPLPIAWSVVEKGAYNISNEFFMIGSGNITRPSSDVAARENHIRFLYPSGCEASNVTCRFPSGSTVGAITQLQTVVNDRFLFARGFNVALFFARFILESHESTDPNYSVLTDPETLAYMSYRPSVAISCVEGMGLETAVLDGITDSPVYFTYHLSYFYEPGLFGMVLSLQGQNPVVLRSFSSTLTDVGMVTEEDQCADEETQHTSDEKVGIIIMGEVTGTDGLVECKVKINQVAPHPSTAPSSVPSSVPSTSTPTTLHPTSAPSALPTTLPSGDPTLLPTGCPTVPPSGMPSNAPSGKPSNYPTTTPSCAPSSTPSGLPSSLPTSIPTHAPSWIPSSHPSTAPSSLPSCIPSSQPSASPSVVPTGIPTTSPSFMPSGHPTSGPTSQPTDYPSSSPSSVPTVMPTTVPTGNPTALPTVQPTGEPTSNPSSCPTALPSCQPTAQPTSTPTSQPSSQPTGAPSLVPTSLPSSYPTSIPSSEPTAEPTSTPTSHPSSQPSSQPTGAPSLVPTSLPSSYPTSIPSSEPTSLPSIHPSNLPTTVPISSPSSIPSPMPSFVPTELPSASPSSCPSQHPFASPTALPSAEPTAGPTSLPSMSPTQFTVWPKYTQSCTVKERSIDVVYSLSARGNIYCAAFEGAELPNLLTTRSISAAEGSTSRTHLFPTSNDTLILSGLKGSTDYKVLCYTEDFINFPGIYTATDLPVVYEKVCAVTTDCCKTVEASITQSSLISGEVSEQIIVQLSSPPSVSVTIIPRMYWGSHDMFGTECIPPADVSVLQLLPNSPGRVTPPALNFTDTVRSTTGMFFISSNASPGCLFFTAEIEGPSSSEYALHIDAPHTLHLGGLSTPSDGNNAAVLSISYATSIPPAPIVGSVYFDATGSNIIVEYNHETDAGVVHGLSNSFPCSEFTSLQLSSTSTCAFTSPRHVRITLAYGDSLLPLVGDNITFLGGKVIARCRMSTDFCMSNYPTERPAVVEISSNFLVQSSDVNVIVLGSHFVSDCHPGLQMDISSSSGSGGRPWSNISWAVYDPSNTRNYVLEDYMQSLAWVNCTPGSVTCNFLPTNIFTAAGIHTFVLYLENYLGHSGYGSFSFEYIPNTNATYVSPVVVSTGSVKGVSYSSLSHTAQAWARYNAVNSCNFTASGLDILYRWEVYINAAAEKSPDIAKLNIASDPRKFIVGSYNLSVGNEYIFRSFASSGPVGNLLNSESAVQSPISESRVYIRQGGLKARITGGSYQSASMASDLIVDASQSYDQDVTGRYGRDAGLYFSWRCVLLSSDMVYECPGFQKVASHDETLRIPSSYLNVSTLAFLVSVTDQAAERRTFAVTVINVVESLPIYVALSFDAGKEQTSNGRFVLDAVVSSPNESYTAFWGITRGNVVHSELEFPLGGSNLISSRFYSSLLSNGAMYTIQLGVTSYPNCDANCFEGVYEISVAINSPPSGGRLDVYPTYEESVYTLWASWWVDDDGDLPLYYTYVQSRKCSKDAVGILQQRSLRTWGVAKVGTGCPASNFSTEVGVIVSDVYGANSSASQTLNIFPQSNTLRNYRMGIQSGTNHYDIDRILQEINSLIGESLDCVDSEEYIEKCLNVTELTAGASSFIVDYIVPDYDTMATLVEEFQFRVEVMKMQSAYWVDRQLLTVDQVQRTVQYTSDLVSVVSSIPVEEMSEYYPLTDLAVAIDKLHQLVDTLPVNETSSSRRLQNGADATLSLRTAMLSLTQIIYSTLITGEQYSLSMGYYDFHTLSVWPSLVSDVVPVSSEDYISTSNIVDGESLDSISLGIAAVKINNGYDSQCNEVNTTCSSESPTLLTAVYVTTNSVNPSYNRTVYTLKNDIKDIDLPDNNVTTEITEFCDNQLNVVMDCSNDTAHGFPYIANFSCSDPFGVWELTCPQYDTTVMCLSSEREECSVEQFTAGFTTCVCDSAPQPAQGRFSSGRNLPTVTGFKTYFTESSNLAVYETIISKDPVAKYTSSPPTSAPSFPQVAKETDVQRPVTSRFPLIIPLLVLFCCCLFCCLLFFCAKPKDDVWMKINNSHPCLRHPVHIYGVGNTFTDIDDDMLLKIYDRAQPIWLDDFDELVGHYSTDSGTNSDTEECHDAGQYYRVCHLTHLCFRVFIFVFDTEWLSIGWCYRGDLQEGSTKF